MKGKGKADYFEYLLTENSRVYHQHIAKGMHTIEFNPVN